MNTDKTIHSNDSIKLKQSQKKIENAFKFNFLEGKEKGAQLTVIVNNQILVDLHGGRDQNSVFDGIALIFSASKVIESLAIAMLVDQGKIQSYDDSVSKYWPRFGEVYGNDISIKNLMRHQAGLEQIRKTLTKAEGIEIFADPDKLEEYVFQAMKVDEDIMLNGKRRTRYHAVTRGIFVDLLIYKIDGRRGQDFIQQEIVDKLPSITTREDGKDFFIGVPKEHV